jgi:hypothetical protein
MTHDGDDAGDCSPALSGVVDAEGIVCLVAEIGVEVGGGVDMVASRYRRNVEWKRHVSVVYIIS